MPTWKSKPGTTRKPGARPGSPGATKVAGLQRRCPQVYPGATTTADSRAEAEAAGLPGDGHGGSRASLDFGGKKPLASPLSVSVFLGLCSSERLFSPASAGQPCAHFPNKNIFLQKPAPRAKHPFLMAPRDAPRAPGGRGYLVEAPGPALGLLCRPPAATS